MEEKYSGLILIEWETMNKQQRDELVTKIVRTNDISNAQICISASYAIDLTDEQRELLEPLALVQEIINKERRARR